MILLSWNKNNNYISIIVVYKYTQYLSDIITNENEVLRISYPNAKEYDLLKSYGQTSIIIWLKTRGQSLVS